MSKQREALEALKEFDRYFTSMNRIDVDRRISVPRDEWRGLRDKIEAALAEPEQEPVAFMNPYGGILSANYIENFASGLEKETYSIPLYTSPQPREWQELGLYEVSDLGVFPRDYKVISAAPRAKNEVKA